VSLKAPLNGTGTPLTNPIVETFAPDTGAPEPSVTTPKAVHGFGERPIAETVRPAAVIVRGFVSCVRYN
jgi:hypothetical protein